MQLRLALTALAASAAFAAAIPTAANASFLVDRGTSGVSLQADNKGEAFVTYRKAGKINKVVLWGGENATTKFGIGRQAGYHSKHDYHKTKFTNQCKSVAPSSLQSLVPTLDPSNAAYDQQETLIGVVAACQMKDGSYWAAQSWGRSNPDFGGTDGMAQQDLRVSHFTGQVADMWIKGDWSYDGMWQHMYGQLTYQGKPWWGVGGQFGAGTDGVARNVSIDSFDSDYPGTQNEWARVNAILTDEPNGQFCFGFAPKFHSATDPGLTPLFKQTFPLWQNALNDTGASATNQYQAEVPGPGVSPDVQVKFQLNDPGTLWLSSSDGDASGHRATGDQVDGIQQAAFLQESSLAAGEPANASCGNLWNGIPT